MPLYVESMCYAFLFWFYIGMQLKDYHEFQKSFWHCDIFFLWFIIQCTQNAACPPSTAPSLTPSNLYSWSACPPFSSEKRRSPRNIKVTKHTKLKRRLGTNTDIKEVCATQMEEKVLNTMQKSQSQTLLTIKRPTKIKT